MSQTLRNNIILINLFLWEDLTHLYKHVHGYSFILNHSISVSDSLRVVGTIEGGWEHSDLIVTVILSPESFGLLVIRQFHQKVENVVSTGVSCLIVLPETRIVVVIFHVGQSNFWVPIEMSLSLLTISHIASKPFVESHCTHDVVIGHWVETVKSVLNFLFGTNSGLEASCRSSGRESFPIHQLFFLESPRLKGQLINIFGLDELILQVQSIEVENLHNVWNTLLVSLNQFLSWSFSQTASVLSL